MRPQKVSGNRYIAIHSQGNSTTAHTVVRIALLRAVGAWSGWRLEEVGRYGLPVCRYCDCGAVITL